MFNFKHSNNLTPGLWIWSHGFCGELRSFIQTAGLGLNFLSFVDWTRTELLSGR